MWQGCGKVLPVKVQSGVTGVQQNLSTVYNSAEARGSDNGYRQLRLAVVRSCFRAYLWSGRKKERKQTTQGLLRGRGLRDGGAGEGAPDEPTGAASPHRRRGMRGAGGKKRHGGKGDGGPGTPAGEPRKRRSGGRRALG